MAEKRMMVAGQLLAVDDETGHLIVDAELDAEVDIGKVNLMNKADATIDPATEDKQDTIITGIGAVNTTLGTPAQAGEYAAANPDPATATLQGTINTTLGSPSQAGEVAAAIPDPATATLQGTQVTAEQAIQAAVASGLPTAGRDDVGAADNAYATVVTAPARQCHYIHVAVANGGARVSLDGGATVHYYIPANTERGFAGLKIPSGAVIKGKKLADGGTQYTNLSISVW